MMGSASRSALGQGRAVTVLPQNAELTTQEVADYLNASRPYVVKLIEEEKLPARKVGTRRRVASRSKTCCALTSGSAPANAPHWTNWPVSMLNWASEPRPVPLR